MKIGLRSVSASCFVTENQLSVSVDESCVVRYSAELSQLLASGLADSCSQVDIGGVQPYRLKVKCY